MSDLEGSAPTADRPVMTWAMMFGASIIIVLLPDWAGTGIPHPLWVMVLPVVFGLGCAGFALVGGHLWWSMISALWGLVLVQALIVIVTLTSGP